MPPAARSRTGTGAAAAIDPVGLAAERVAAAAEAAHVAGDPLVLTARCENFLHGVRDLDDTIARLCAYRDAGADCVYAPGLTTGDEIRTVVDAVGVPVNVLAWPGGPSVAEIGEAGGRRVSVGSSLASTAYGALMVGGQRAARIGHQHLPSDSAATGRPRRTRLTQPAQCPALSRAARRR